MYSMKRCAIALALILSLLSLASAGFSGCGGKHNNITSITVTPVDPIFVKGTTLQLITKAHLADGMTVNFWTQVTWKSSDPAIATVNATGLVFGIQAGTVVITAADIARPSITCSITVNVTDTPLASIDVAPSNLIISMGTTTLFTATWTLADGTHPPNLGSSANWSSSHTGVAIISNNPGSEGLATAIAPGTTLIVATDPVTNISGLTTLTVTP
jgi:trimeric autotransporter adhesin